MTQPARPTARPRISRRSLVKRGLALAALGGAAGAGVLTWGHGGRYADPVPACDLHYLQRREFAILAALANALFPPGNDIGLSGTDARIPEYVDRMLAGMSQHKAAEFRAMLLLFEHGTLAFGLRARRFTDLSLPARERYLRRWEEARVYSRRILAAGLKTVLGIAYFAHPKVQAKLGMDRICASPADAVPREEWS
ncbi:MAG: gluconate 2-dehydrogenase subunit 3 family protein [Myxococcota bacterium]|nr:gluconate 2-dehydrogenase subunit 3 family protein [Myxococcota bacterium]